MNLPEQIKSIFGKKNMQYGIGIILLGFLVWLSFKPKKVNAETAIIQRGTLIQFVEEEGISRVKEKFQIFSPVNGVLKNTGDKVKKGEVVALIDWDYKREVLSPISGKILIIHRESAGPIAMGNPIMDIGDISTQEIVVEILTQEAVKIQAGNPVSIEGWGGNPLEGKVRLVEPEAFKKISSLGVEEQRVKDGFKVLCKIQIQKEDNKVLAPSSSLFREGENWAVYKVVKGRIQKAIVKVETRSGNFVSIAEGLQENEEVILFPSEGIKEGLKIRK